MWNTVISEVAVSGQCNYCVEHVIFIIAMYDKIIKSNQIKLNQSNQSNNQTWTKCKHLEVCINLSISFNH